MKIFDKAKQYFESLNKEQIDELKATVLYGLPGSLEAYSLEDFKKL